MTANSSPVGWWWGYKLSKFGYLQTPEIFKCPSGNDDSYTLYLNINDVHVADVEGSYGYGLMGGGSGRNETRFTKSFSQICVLADSNYFIVFAGNVSGWADHKVYRHNPNANLLFADGHTASVKISEISSKADEWPWYHYDLY
jgi:prepilin-type processing-associated H-X9-DG protein